MASSRMVNTNKSRVTVWNPPSDPMIKVNVDGAWKATSRESGVGVILRDYIRGLHLEEVNVFIYLVH